MADLDASAAAASFAATPPSNFRPALVVVDMQLDFCPPNGSLAVPDGLSALPAVNYLLERPAFMLRIATQDWHPPDHVSFASNHPGTTPFVDTATITNPLNAAEPPYETRLWPIHCVQHTPGAALVPGLDITRIDAVVQKGTDPRVEMYSAFYDPFRCPRVSDSGLTARLRAARISHIYIVGLAADYCVRCTAEDAVREGFSTFIVEDGTRAVDVAAWAKQKAIVQAAGVAFVRTDGPEVSWLN